MISSTSSVSKRYNAVSKHIYQLCLPLPEGKTHIHKATTSSTYLNWWYIVNKILKMITLQYAQIVYEQSPHPLHFSWRKSWIRFRRKVYRFWYMSQPEALAGLVMPGIVLFDCLTQKRESYLLHMVRLFLKDAHKDITSSIQRDKGVEGLNNS